MPPSAYLSTPAVTRWYRGAHPTGGVAQALKSVPSSLAWQVAYLLDTVEGDTILSEVDQVLLLVGTLCVQHHQPELWRTIYHAALAHPQRDTNEAFEYLEHLSDAARRGEL